VDEGNAYRLGKKSHDNTLALKHKIDVVLSQGRPAAETIQKLTLNHAKTSSMNLEMRSPSEMSSWNWQLFPIGSVP
jgi:hypothetical protein